MVATRSAQEYGMEQFPEVKYLYWSPLSRTCMC